MELIGLGLAECRAEVDVADEGAGLEGRDGVAERRARRRGVGDGGLDGGDDLFLGGAVEGQDAHTGGEASGEFCEERGPVGAGGVGQCDVADGERDRIGERTGLGRGVGEDDCCGLLGGFRKSFVRCACGVAGDGGVGEEE